MTTNDGCKNLLRNIFPELNIFSFCKAKYLILLRELEIFFNFGESHELTLSEKATRRNCVVYAATFQVTVEILLPELEKVQVGEVSEAALVR